MEDYLPDVKAQYEDYPYPYRNPEDEKTRLHSSAYAEMELVNMFCFEGKQSFENGFRVLVAGGGTGDAVIIWAEQLRERGGEVVYLDLSKASRNIAEERAKIRQLTNVTWHTASILDIPSMDIGTFDLIDCGGVLHHLADPDAGLAALASVLKPEGVMELMVYATYGRQRAGVYWMQDIMRHINQGIDDQAEQVARCKALLSLLPTEHPLRAVETSFGDIDDMGDIGLYDLCLHTQDVPFSVPEVYAWLKRHDLKLYRFFECLGDYKNQSNYEIGQYITSPVVQKRVETLPLESQQAIAEILSSVIKHSFYVGKIERKEPSIEDEEMVPFFSKAFREVGMVEHLKMRHEQEPEAKEWGINLNVCSIEVKNTRYFLDILNYIDGQHSVKEICEKVAKQYEKKPPNKGRIIRELKILYDVFKPHRGIVLRHVSIPSFPEVAALQERVSALYVGDQESLELTS